MISREAKHLALAATVLTLVIWVVGAGGQQYEEEISAPAARATERAAERVERRAGMDFVARETIRAGRREERREIEQPVEIRNPIPLPVEVRNPATLVAAGKPVAGACPTNTACTLSASPSIREVLIITAVWSATRVECDGVVGASPADGTPIAPWWRCQQRFTVEGPGAGYTGFIIVQ